MSIRGLTKRALSALVIVCGVGVFASPPITFAQTSTSGDGGAGSFLNGNPVPPLGDPSTAVPGAGSDASGWENHYGDPDKLISTGEANAPGNEYLEVIGGGSTNAARYKIDSNDDWLKSSLDAMNNPGDYAGDLTGDKSTSCTETTEEVTKSEETLYTCETAQDVTEEFKACNRIYVPIFDTDYVYSCQTGTKWTAESKTCEPERIVTVDEDYVYQCKTGTVWTHTPASCERKRIVVVDEDYMYGCVRTWNGSTHAPNAACNANGQAGCVPSGGQVCAAPSGLPSSYTCQQGYQGSEKQEICRVTQDIQYSSNVSAVGRVARFKNNAAYSITRLRSFLPGCTVEWLGGEVSSADGLERAFSVTCSSQPAMSGWSEYHLAGEDMWIRNDTSGGLYSLKVSRPFKQAISDTETTVRSCPGNVGNDPSCRIVTNACVENGGTRTINGQQVYRDCWAWEEIYTCGSQSNYAGCAPPAGMSQTGERCIATNSSGVCTGTEKTYVDPTGGCARYEQNVRCEDPAAGAGTPSQVIRDVVSDTWDNGCNALAGNGACVKQGEVVVEGNATKTINGLAVTRNPWTVREDYICSSSSNVNSCTPFTGCKQQSQTCASQDRSGTCTAYDRRYLCENPVNNGGTPIETPREVVGEYWTDPCAVNRNDSACRQTANQVLIGNETRVINGLSVTRDPWKRRETWTCDRSAGVNTCAPVAGCTKTGQICAGNDPQGNCSLWNDTYRCENRSPGVGTPSGEVTDHVDGAMEDQACPPKSDGQCRLTKTECTQPGPTQVVNGVTVTAPCFEETDTYTCERYGPSQSTCNPPSGCELKEEICLDTPANGGPCRTFENVYQCHKETVVDRTTNSCQTKVCIGQFCVTNDDSSDDNMPDALAALLIAQMAGQDYEKDLTIFKGTPMRCRKAVLGFRNCCKDSGWGVELGLTQCSEEEKTLMTRQEGKAAHYIGTYCSQKTFFGVCTEKAMRYCTFEGTLAKIVHIAGRPQVGKGWGTAENADCSGFTVEEFQKLDLTDVDFSEFTDDLMNNIQMPGVDSTVGRLQQSIEGLMGSGSAGFGETNEAGNTPAP